MRIPEVIIIQEPMEGLSQINASKLYNTMKKFKIQGEVSYILQNSGKMLYNLQINIDII